MLLEPVSLEPVLLELASLELVSLELASLELVSLELASLEPVSLELTSLELVSLELAPWPPEESVPESVGAAADISTGDWMAATAVVAPAKTRSPVVKQDAQMIRGILRRTVEFMTNPYANCVTW
ncbi:hypothetical protein HEP87_42975 [Streptomyces sp. S1D4-11]|nr:hypothetical protein [Streptomyces sp. S1D4-11]QIY99447.1 hypothetical protein HEP87_42975 [Streptomyces sp. S1D4-11]